MCNFIEYSENYLKTSGSLWQYYKGEPNDNLKITGNNPADGYIKDVEIIVPLKYLSNFWWTPEMPLIVKLILFWHGHQLVLLLILQVQVDLQ